MLRKTSSTLPQQDVWNGNYQPISQTQKLLGFVNGILWFPLFPLLMLNSQNGAYLSSLVSGSLLQKMCLSSKCYVSTHTHTYTLTQEWVFFHAFEGCVPECDAWKTIVAYCCKAGSNFKIRLCLNFTVQRPIQSPRRNWNGVKPNLETENQSCAYRLLFILV